MLADIKLSLFLAYKSIARGNRGTLILTVFIMSLIFINLAFIGSLLLGLTETMNNQVINTLYGNIIIEPNKNETYISDVYALKQKINGVRGIRGISSQYVIGAALSYKDKSGVWSVRSINPDDEETVTTIHNFMIDGEYLSKQDTGEIMIGKEIAGGYSGDLEHISLGGVRVGDSIDVLFNNGVKRRYRVKGIFGVNFMQSDLLAFVSQKEMESVLGIENRATQVLIKIEDRGNEEKYIKQLLDLGVKEEIKPWPVYAGIVKNLITSIDLIASLISGIGLFVASMMIFIVIYMNTISKRKQIGILRAIGIKESIIINSYIFQAMFIVVCGTAMGLLITLLVIVPIFIEHPMKFPVGYVSLSIVPGEISLSALSLFAVALMAGFVPSWMAVRQTIIDAIWGD